MRSARSRIARGTVLAIGSGVLAASLTAGTASASTTAPYIRQGSVGTGVKCVQLALNQFDTTLHLAVDGVDGPRTTAGVKEFQNALRLIVDGIVGPATGNVIWSVDNVIGAQYCFSYVPTSS